jgi:phosphatidylglycerophosphatase A
MQGLNKMIATFFYTGEVRFAPGTVASFVSLLLFLSLYEQPVANFLVYFLLFVLGFLTAGPAEQIFGKKDPRQVVIDEAASIYLVFFMVPVTVWTLALGFLSFRFFDCLKPFPARRLERLEGGLGIMADDIICGIYANLLLRLVLRFFPFLQV